jgi:hypothetical protein
MTKKEAAKKRSVIASGLLSFFFGPLGWLYAAPWKSAIIGGGAYLLVAAILPSFLMMYVVAIVAPVSAIAGVLYALGYNLAGARTPLFGKSDEVKRLAR